MTGCGVLPPPEASFSSGQSFGFDAKYQATPLRTNLQFPSIRFDNFKISAGPELVTDIISQPQRGYLAGVCGDVRLSYRISDWTFFGEGGSGPVYLSIPTPEQGNPGFNFLDQVGVGIDYHLTENLGFGVRYRLAHISDAGIRDIPNHGINSNTLMLSFSLNF